MKQEHRAILVLVASVIAGVSLGTLLPWSWVVVCLVMSVLLAFAGFLDIILRTSAPQRRVRTSKDDSRKDASYYAPSGDPWPTTAPPTFEPGHGRPDLQMLHDVVAACDRGASTFEVREMVAGWLVWRERNSDLL